MKTYSASTIDTHYRRSDKNNIAKENMISINPYNGRRDLLYLISTREKSKKNQTSFAIPGRDSVMFISVEQLFPPMRT